MKISDLTKSSQLLRGMQIPVAIEGENRVVELGQLLDAMADSVVPFSTIQPYRGPFDVVIKNGSTEETGLPIVYSGVYLKFYAVKSVYINNGPVMQKSNIFYPIFEGSEKYVDDDGNCRQNCLFIDEDGKLYKFNGEELIAAGMTADEANQLKLLVPQEVESEAALEAMETAGLIVPGQIYYIPDND